MIGPVGNDLGSVEKVLSQCVLQVSRSSEKNALLSNLCKFWFDPQNEIDTGGNEYSLTF